MVELSPGPNMLRAYMGAEQIKGLRNRNALAGQEMERTQQFNALAPQMMAGDEAAQREAIGLDPAKASAMLDTFWEMDDRQKADTQAKGQAAAKNMYLVSQASPQEQGEAWGWLRGSLPDDPDDPMPEQFDAFWLDRNIAEWQTLEGMMKKGKPLSPLGKFESDVASGFIDPETAAARRKKLTAPAGPLVKIDSGQTIDEKLLDMDLKTITGTRDAVKAGEDFMPRLEVIVQGLESGNVETGRWQEATLPVRQWAQSAGWHDDPTLGEQEAVLAAISYMIPRMRVVGSGQTSDVEIKLFSQATAQYSNTPKGNILIARTMMQIQRRNKELLTGQRSWVRKHKTLEGFDADKEIGPMFPKITTQEQADSLSPGTVFIDTNDGRFKVKQ